MNKPHPSAQSERRKPSAETLGPITKNRRSKVRSKSLTLILSILIVTGLIFGGYILNAKQNDGQNLNNQITTPADNTATLKAEAKAETTTESDLEEEVEQKPAVIHEPIIVFEPEGVFSDEEKSQLMDKLVDPMVAYQPDTYAAIHIEIYSQDKFVGGASDEKYIVTTIGRDDSGGTGGFLYGSKKNGLEYWVPECLDACEFTDEFKRKYPEVVKKYKQQS